MHRHRSCTRAIAAAVVLSVGIVGININDADAASTATRPARASTHAGAAMPTVGAGGYVLACWVESKPDTEGGPERLCRRVTESGRVCLINAGYHGDPTDGRDDVIYTDRAGVDRCTTTVV